MKQIIPISQLTLVLKGIIEDDEDLQDLWVDGEISNLTIARSGHAYFSLKDDQSQLSAVMWRNALQRQRSMPSEGDRVIAHGDVTMYIPRGTLQLQVDVLQPQGTGLLQLQLEELRQRLEAEGLFDASRKRPLPAFPRRIGVVTSPTGAVWHGIQTVIARRYPMAELMLSPAIVQGDAAPASIVSALQRIQEAWDPDVLIVGRGGGSLEDLWAFNDERVVRALFATRVPVVSAVGHETDVTLADEVADRRAPTPSAAAELVVPDVALIDQALGEMRLRLHTQVANDLQRRLQLLDDMQERLARLSPEWQLAGIARELYVLVARGQRAIASQLRDARLGLGGLQSTLDALNPQSLLQRGYAFVEDATSRQPIRSVRAVQDGQRIRTTVADGAFDATVTDIAPDRS